MLSLNTLNELDGKTIKSHVQSGSELLFVFTDDSYILFVAVDGYEGGDGDIGTGAWRYGRSDIPSDDAVAVGLLTQEELDALIENEKRSRERHAEERDRSTFERLRAKYGATPEPESK